MSSNNNGKDWYNGEGSTWDAVKAGLTQGAKDFVKNPVESITQAHDDFSNAGNLTDAFTGQGGSGGNNGNNNGKGGSDGKTK